MTLLFDHNVSPRLVEQLADIFPGSSHVLFVGLDQATDSEVWEYATSHNFAIATKDADFNDLSMVWGSRRKSSGFVWAIVQPDNLRRFYVPMPPRFVISCVIER